MEDKRKVNEVCDFDHPLKDYEIPQNEAKVIVFFFVSAGGVVVEGEG
jgi:hypothetical protein